MHPDTLTKKQAARFLLRKHGLYGPYRFIGPEGVLEYARQAGCIQFDPLDICGQNAQLVLQSRVKGFTKDMLDDLLYTQRKLVDYFDKNLAILPTEDWKYFARTRQKYCEKSRSRQAVDEAAGEVKRIVGERGFACARDLGMQQRVDWYWSPSTLARVALETLYFRGELIVHHKAGNQKYYGLARDYLPAEVLAAPDPNETREEYLRWQALRRIGSVGLLWCRPSAAWLGVEGFAADTRQTTFQTLLEQKKLLEITVEGVKWPLYCRAGDEDLLREAIREEDAPPRMEFLAPLDNLLWDRELIHAVFGFDYKWEVYTPVSQRKYGHYVLPILYGDGLIGRVQAKYDKRESVLRVENVWREESWPEEAGDALEDCARRFAAFHGCSRVIFP